MVDKIIWTNEKRRLGDLTYFDGNPRHVSVHDAENIKQSIDTFGLADPLIINLDNTILGGNTRKCIIGDDDQIVDVRVPHRLLTDREASELNIRLNRNRAEFDIDMLANNYEIDDLLDWGFTEFNLGIDSEIDYKKEWEGMPEFIPEDNESFRKIIIHFKTQEDVDIFAQLIDQKISEKVKFIWFPFRERQDLKSLVIVDES